jgi:hypothetical protein
MPLRAAIVLLLGLALVGCASAKTEVARVKHPLQASRILLMPLDIELSEMTAGGLLEPRADWTAAAKKDLTAAIEQSEAAQGVQVVEFDESHATAERLQTLDEVVKLNRAVSTTIALQQGDDALPTKRGKMEWTLGSAMQGLRAETGADYAMFVYVRDSYASAGRAAVMVLAFATIGAAIPGGAQFGHVSLVDLATGDVVWFADLASRTGDLRTPEAARASAGRLLAGFPK